jgi:hypothetical protein
MNDLWNYIDSNFQNKNQVPRDFRNGEGSIYISRVPKAIKEVKSSSEDVRSSENNKEIELKNKKIKELENLINIERSKFQKKIELLNIEVLEYKNNNHTIVEKPEIRLTVGSYVQFGKYYNEPVLWKCMKNDEFGYLLVSEYIICLKPFDAAESGRAKRGKNDVEKYGSNRWNNSNIRDWLNSNEVNVEYKIQTPTKNAVWRGYNAYADEPGFLTNFKNDDVSKINFYKHDDDTSDKVFLLSKDELEALWSDKKNRIKLLTESAVENSDYKSENIVTNINHWYWTRTPSPSYSNGVYFVSNDGSFSDYCRITVNGYIGVVPALYLKSDICESGKGSKKEPFIIK